MAAKAYPKCKKCGAEMEMFFSLQTKEARLGKAIKPQRKRNSGGFQFMCIATDFATFHEVPTELEVYLISPVDTEDSPEVGTSE